MFFIISGFLSKKLPLKVFSKKIARQLLIPMFILGMILVVVSNIKLIVSGDFTFGNFGENILGIMIGEQIVLGGLWFVYTLILVKIISQLLSQPLKLLLVVVLLICAVKYNSAQIHDIQNCWLNILLAYPMFYLGELMSGFKQKISNISDRVVLISLLIAGGVGIWICGVYNEPVWMYRCLYGSSIILFIIGSICGTVMIFAISKMFFDRSLSVIKYISEGSILILAFHILFVRIGLHFPVGYGYYLESVLIMLLFVPVIRICQRFCPILLGYRGVKKPQSVNNAAV